MGYCVGIWINTTIDIVVANWSKTCQKRAMPSAGMHGIKVLMQAWPYYDANVSRRLLECGTYL